MPTLVIAQGPRSGARFAVDGDLVIGRSPSCDVSVVDIRTSRRHARVRQRGGRSTVVDLGSRNGTFLNGERVERETPLVPGDRLQVGDTTFLFDPPMRAAIDDETGLAVEAAPVEELLPVAGAAAAVLNAAAAVIPAASDGAVLRAAAEAGARAVSADVAAALLPGEQGLLAAAVSGAAEARIPRELLRAAVERREVATAGPRAAAPLWSGGTAFGLLYAARAGEPFSREELAALCALGRVCGEALTAVRARATAPDENALVGTSRPFRKVLEQARRAGATTGPVVLRGEPGTGKSLLAAYVHARSARAMGPLVRVDCREPSSAVDDELFGRPAGPGLPPLPSALARADGGTLVLAGVEAIARPAADRLSGLIGRGKAPTAGGGEAVCDVRVVATGGAPLEELSRRGEFDLALGRALSGAAIDVPPLRDRKGDVPLLFDHFAGRAARRERKAPPSLGPEAIQRLGEYRWPANVRELRLCAERLAILGIPGDVGPSYLPREIQEGSIEEGSAPLADLVARLERDAIQGALRRAGGKKIRAAALLGISRPTLDKKIAIYGLALK